MAMSFLSMRAYVASGLVRTTAHSSSATRCTWRMSSGLKAQFAPAAFTHVASTRKGASIHLKRNARCIRLSGQARADHTLNLPLDQDLEQPLPGFDSIASSLEALSAGKFVVVLDDENRENEGDLIMNADKVTTETMAFMVEHTSGVICIGMEGQDLDRLRLPLMISSAENEDTMYTAFTVTVDLRDDITTGISASDRAKTLRRLSDPAARPEQFRRPGHIFPLRSRPGGVLTRPGHTEAGVDLARLSGSFPAGALCEIVSKVDGSMARTPELQSFARQHGLPCITIADLMRYRLRHDTLLTQTGTSEIRTQRYGRLQVHTFRSSLNGAEHVAVVAGDVKDKQDVLVHVQRESSMADLLHGGAPISAQGAPTSSDRLSNSVPTTDVLQQLAAHSQGGVLLYMRQAPGASLAKEVQQLALSGSASCGATTLGLCDYGLAAQMLTALGVRSVIMASGDAEQLTALRSCGVLVADVAPAFLGSSPAIGDSVSGHREAACT